MTACERRQGAPVATGSGGFTCTGAGQGALVASYKGSWGIAPGFGPQRLATLAAYALRRDLLLWLESFKVEKEAAECLRARREVRNPTS